MVLPILDMKLFIRMRSTTRQVLLERLYFAAEGRVRFVSVEATFVNAFKLKGEIEDDDELD
jgi:hypothetical protein